MYILYAFTLYITMQFTVQKRHLTFFYHLFLLRVSFK